VKIRGFRVELGEIENRLLNYPGLREVVVLVREDMKEDKYICAYFVSDSDYGISELREYLLMALPDYMIPSYFVRLEKIPLAPNGKLDRKALPRPELKANESYTAPGNEIETKLVEIWSEVLGGNELHAAQMQTAIGIDDNFFRLGGHSLRGILLTFSIHKEFDVHLPLTEVFMNPTIRELAEVIKGMAKDKYTPIEPVEKKDYYALSSAQQRLYFLQRMTPEGTVYNIPQITSLDEITDTVKLTAAFKQLINHHESLRTSYLVIDDEPVQRIHESVPFILDYLEIKDVNGLQVLIDRFVSSFDLSCAPLLRAAVVEIEQGQRLLLTDMHHITGDGVSSGILVKDFMSLYQEEELPPLRLQYKDFSQWQNSRQVIQKLKSQKDYWLRQFPGDIPRLNLPGDYPRTGLNSFEGDTHAFEINMNQTALLKQMALEQGTTIFMVMLSIFYILLAKVSQQEDIIIGTAVTGRGHADLKKIIGMFVNMLALRNYPRGSLSFLEFLAEVKQRSIKAFENQEFPFEKLVMELDLNRNHSFNPLFEVAFSLNTLPVADIPFAGGRASREIPLDKAWNPDYQLDLKISKFALILTGNEIEGQLHMIFEYSSMIFKEERIRRFAGYFKEIVTTVLTNRDIQLKEIRLATDLFDQKINNPMVALEL
jgi:tyrocidine synthetase-3